MCGMWGLGYGRGGLTLTFIVLGLRLRILAIGFLLCFRRWCRRIRLLRLRFVGVLFFVVRLATWIRFLIVRLTLVFAPIGVGLGRWGRCRG